jgi:hypothetical protein
LALSVLILVFDGIDAGVGLSEAALFLALLQTSNVVSLTPSNLGVQELSFGALATGLGIGIGPGLLAASIVRVTGLVALALGAAAVRIPRSGGTIKDSGPEVERAP